MSDDDVEDFEEDDDFGGISSQLAISPESSDDDGLQEAQRRC